MLLGSDSFVYDTTMSEDWRLYHGLDRASVAIITERALTEYAT
jgi:hypothetical protein